MGITWLYNSTLLKPDKLLAGALALVLIAGLVTPALADPDIDDGSSTSTPVTPNVDANAVLIDFEACVGIVASYVEDGATVTSTTGNLNCIPVLAGFNGVVAVGGTNPFFPVRTDFPTTVTAVTAVVGDAAQDIDGSVFMNAFNSLDVMVDSDTVVCGACDSAIPLSVSDPNIAYIITGSTVNSGGSSVVVDDIVFTPQDENVGGELLPINAMTLLLAGAQTNLVWIFPVVLAGLGFAAFKLRRK